MDRLLNVTAALSLIMIALVLISVRRSHIRVEYSVSWLGAGVVLLILSRNGAALNWLADLIGISYPPLALLLAVLCVFLFVFYQFSLRISDLKDANIALAQRVAILEYQLQSVHEENQTNRHG